MNFETIAPYLKHPLVLVGFALMLFFGLLRAVLKSGLLPQLTRGSGARVLQQLLAYAFVIALVLILLGFALVYFKGDSVAQSISSALSFLA